MNARNSLMLLVFMAATLAACSGGSKGAGGGDAALGRDGGPEDPGPDAGVPDGGPDAGPDGGAAGELTVEEVAWGLDVPWELRFLPDGDLLVTERPGNLVRVDPETAHWDVVGTVPVFHRGEAGLMGLALDPAFADNGHLYLCYSHGPEDAVRNRISRFVLGEDGLSDETVLVDDIEGAILHDGCRLEIGPDGRLWATMGESGVSELAQDQASLNGKVLRLALDGSVPPDNPYPDSYVYAVGLRNPQGLTFHPGSGTAVLTEHGPDDNDEINLVERGQNYGWPEVTGAAGDPRFQDPVLTWTPTIAPAGVVWYDRTEIPQFTDSLLLVTLKERDLRHVVPTDGSLQELTEVAVLLDEAWGRLRAIRVGPDGWVYLSTSNRDGRGSPQPEDDRILRLRLR